ncbi:MAG: BlaI/MecI/CopY family transcriptional regulator [Lachnospiraceae bacterium]|nr:BlaI/MecI/CopY family transcriptional regulator [Lachnospiraceae bacterium]
MITMTETEEKFAGFLWDRVPFSSSELVRLGEEKMEWKKSTTYTMLKRLEQKGIFQNKGGTVQAMMEKDDYYASQSRQFVRDTFGGSLPRFLTAFTRKEKLSKEEIDELRQLIENCEEE